MLAAPAADGHGGVAEAEEAKEEVQGNGAGAEQGVEGDHAADAVAVEGADARPNNRGPPPALSTVRVALLCASALLSIFGAVTVALHAPLHSGRFALGFLLGVHGGGHDFYSLSIGILIVWAVGTSVRCVIQCVRGWGFTWRLVQAACQWAVALAKCAVLLFLMAGVAPLILGTLFEVLVVVPLRVPLDETPMLTLSQNWALVSVEVCWLAVIVCLCVLPCTPPPEM